MMTKVTPMWIKRKKLYPQQVNKGSVWATSFKNKSRPFVTPRLRVISTTQKKDASIA